jgi:hypothetical protein
VEISMTKVTREFGTGLTFGDLKPGEYFSKRGSKTIGLVLGLQDSCLDTRKASGIYAVIASDMMPVGLVMYALNKMPVTRWSHVKVSVDEHVKTEEATPISE